MNPKEQNVKLFCALCYGSKLWFRKRSLRQFCRRMLKSLAFALMISPISHVIFLVCGEDREGRIGCLERDDLRARFKTI